tara:strand:- start:88417 stop:89175 length:759 start_codon:yes stop_codon:yes gene_type:complete
MRTFLTCLPSLEKYLITPLQPDIFIHTWAQVGQSVRDKSGPDKDLITLDELSSYYDPIKAVVEEYSTDFTEKLFNVEVPELLKEAEPLSYKGAIPMYYKIAMCNSLKQEHEAEMESKYDYVIRLRPDLQINEPIPRRIFDEPNVLWYGDQHFNDEKKVSDKFAIGTSEAIDTYSDVWRRLPEYWQLPLGEPRSDGKKYNHRVGERLMKYHLSNYPDQFELRQLPVECQLVRNQEPNGSKSSWIKKFAKFFVS